MSRTGSPTIWVMLFNGTFVVLGLGALIFGALGGGLALLLIGISFVVTGLLMGGLMMAMDRMQARIIGQVGAAVRAALPPADEALRETGLPGSAVVLALADTGTTINDDPVVRFSVQVSPADGSPDFAAEFSRRVSRIAVPRKGDHCPVQYDPADRARILPTGDFADGPRA